MLSRIGNSCLSTGKIWSSVKSALINSAMTCIAPCTDGGAFDERSAISASSRSGHSSGQSAFAIVVMICA